MWMLSAHSRSLDDATQCNAAIPSAELIGIRCTSNIMRQFRQPRADQYLKVDVVCQRVVQDIYTRKLW